MTPPSTPDRQMTLVSVGEVRTDTTGRLLAVAPPFRASLRGLADFSHVYAVWWADRYDEPDLRSITVTPLPYADGREVGVFACRAPVRPNLLMVSLCAIASVDEATGVVRVRDIDALDGSPLLDLKPYYGCTDRVRAPQVPPYLAGWDEWFPDQGVGLLPGEA